MNKTNSELHLSCSKEVAETILCNKLSGPLKTHDSVKFEDHTYYINGRKTKNNFRLNLRKSTDDVPLRFQLHAEQLADIPTFEYTLVSVESEGEHGSVIRIAQSRRPFYIFLLEAVATYPLFWGVIMLVCSEFIHDEDKMIMVSLLLSLLHILNCFLIYHNSSRAKATDFNQLEETEAIIRGWFPTSLK